MITHAEQLRQCWCAQIGVHQTNTSKLPAGQKVRDLRANPTTSVPGINSRKGNHSRRLFLVRKEKTLYQLGRLFTGNLVFRIEPRSLTIPVRLALDRSTTRLRLANFRYIQPDLR